MSTLSSSAILGRRDGGTAVRPVLHIEMLFAAMKPNLLAATSFVRPVDDQFASMNSDSGDVFADLEATRGRPALDIMFLSVEQDRSSSFYKLSIWSLCWRFC